jgi:tungstate transport system substrate-binding protein
MPISRLSPRASSETHVNTTDAHRFGHCQVIPVRRRRNLQRPPHFADGFRIQPPLAPLDIIADPRGGLAIARDPRIRRREALHRIVVSRWRGSVESRCGAVADPEAEQKFIDDDNGLNRRQIAWNDFVIVGPKADPAHIAGDHDAVAALKTIAAAKVAFVSRDDRSGTNALELRLLKAADIDPTAADGVLWHRDIGGGMGQALNAAAAMAAYTLSDRGTWLSFRNRASLVIVIDPLLINRYDVIELNPQKYADRNLAAAHVFADWLVSPAGQAIGEYKVSGEQLFIPSAADPK